MSDLARAFMEKYAVPGLFDCSRTGGAIIYQNAFGFADQENREQPRPPIFRIASVSKTITSVTIFSLIDQAASGSRTRSWPRLRTDYGRPPYHPGVDQITLEHLLTHTGGGWCNSEQRSDVQNP